MQLFGSVQPNSVLAALEGESGPLSIDLSAATWVQPFGLVAIAVLAETARRQGRATRLTAPNDSDVGNYVSRMRLGNVLDDLKVTHNVHSVRANELSSELLELQKVSGQHAGEQVAELVFNKLDRAGVDPTIRTSLHDSICEVVANMDYHARSDGGWVAAQTTHSGRKITFAIADSGRGMLASLRDNPALVVDGDENALELAVAANISATGERGRGQGLTAVIESSTQIHGTVHIASGVAYARHKRNDIRKNVSASRFPGTIIQVELTP